MFSFLNLQKFYALNKGIKASKLFLYLNFQSATTMKKSSTQSWFYLNYFRSETEWHPRVLNTSSRSRVIQVFEIYKWEAYDVICSQRLSKIHKMGISLQITGRKYWSKLCTCTSMRIVHGTMYSMLLVPKRPLGNWSIFTKNWNLNFCLFLKG